MIELIRDITNRIRLEETLATTEVHLQQFMELAPLATYAKNHAGQYIDANPAACVLFGKRKEELLGKTDLELFSRETAEKLREGEQEVWQKHGSVSMETELEIGDRRIFLSTVKFPDLEPRRKPDRPVRALPGRHRPEGGRKGAERDPRVPAEHPGQLAGDHHHHRHE